MYGLRWEFLRRDDAIAVKNLNLKRIIKNTAVPNVGDEFNCSSRGIGITKTKQLTLYPGSSIA
jgi:hypothetical protein